MSRNIKRNKVCAHCGERNQHHRSLCPTRFTNNNSSSGLSSIDSEAKTQLTDTTKTNVLMQTPTTEVKNMHGESPTSVCLILDSGSQRTYITDKLAKELKLEVSPPEKILVVTFGVDKAKTIQCRTSKLQLCLKDGSVMSNSCS